MDEQELRGVELVDLLCRRMDTHPEEFFALRTNNKGDMRLRILQEPQPPTEPASGFSVISGKWAGLVQLVLDLAEPSVREQFEARTKRAVLEYGAAVFSEILNADDTKQGKTVARWTAPEPSVYTTGSAGHTSIGLGTRPKPSAWIEP